MILLILIIPFIWLGYETDWLSIKLPVGTQNAPDLDCTTSKFEVRVCKYARSRNIYNEGFCGEFKTYTLPARTIKAWGSTLNLVEGCNRCRAKLLKQIAYEQRRKSQPVLRGTQIWHKLPDSELAKYRHSDNIDILVDGKLKASINGDYKYGAIKDIIKPYTTKVRVGKKQVNLAVGEADRI